MVGAGCGRGEGDADAPGGGRGGGCKGASAPCSRGPATKETAADSLRITAEETSGVSGYANAPISGRSRPSSSTSADTRWPPTTSAVTLYAPYAMAPTATKLVRPPTSCATSWLASP